MVEFRQYKTVFLATITLVLCLNMSFAEERRKCEKLPSHADLRNALRSIVSVGNTNVNGGLANDMWATIVNRDGQVCAVTFSGDKRGDQWPASRVISSQKANTANSLSLPKGSGGISGLALSTANLYSAVQPGGSLFGLQESNPVDVSVAYGGPSRDYGRRNDPMVGKKIGGVNVFGGGLALYNKEGMVIGALGVSGDTSCTDHIIAWKVRDTLGLDHVPAGVSSTGDDNIVHDVTGDLNTGHTVSEGGFGHPTCDNIATDIANRLPETHPIGTNGPR